MHATMKATLTAAALAIAAATLLAAAGPAYRIGLLSLPATSGLMRWVAYGGLAAVLIAAAACVLAYRRQDGKTALAAAAAVLAGILVAGIALNWQRLEGRVPPVPDISTDLDNPPQFDALLAVRGESAVPSERSPLIDEQQRESYPGVAPITVSQPPDVVFDRALAVAQDNGWEIVTADKSAGHIEAVATTRWFGFTDDIVIRITAWGSGSRVDVRSASRLDSPDIGTNGRRIRQFLSSLQAG